MSTNKTPNYQLHSWLGTDDFRFHEVNENFTALDDALSQVDAEQKERSTVVFGAYIGTGKPLYLELGCVPKAMLVMRSSLAGSTEGCRYYGLLIPGLNDPAAVFEGTGVTLYTGEGQVLRQQGAEYHYALFL